MSPVAELAGKNLYLSDFEEVGSRLAGRNLPWLRQLRQGAIARFAELDFPTIRNEDWKYTNVAPLTKVPFRPASQNGRATLPAKDRFSVPFAGAGFAQLVFVDGRYSPEHSRLAALPAGVDVLSLREVLESNPKLVEEHLGRHLDYRRHAFAALNTAFLDDGAFVRVPESLLVPVPLHLLFLSTGHEEPAVTHPRNLILAGSGSAVTIIEQYSEAMTAASTYFTNAVTEIIAGQGAQITHYRLQEECEAAYHIGIVQVGQDRDSRVTSHSLSRGARLARIEIQARLDAPGVDCTLRGLYLARGRQHVDHHTLIDHLSHHGTSQELFKGILDDESRGVFTGRIIVNENAPKTSAHQTNRNLLLSDEALADARPQFEIRNNDVACTHGATIGRLDEEMIFYLRSRGIALGEARNLLAYAFANEVLSSVRVPEVRTAFDSALVRWLAESRNVGPARGEGA